MIPLTAKLERGRRLLSPSVAQYLGLPYEQRSQRFWSHYTDMAYILNRDLL